MHKKLIICLDINPQHSIILIIAEILILIINIPINDIVKNIDEFCCAERFDLGIDT